MGGSVPSGSGASSGLDVASGLGWGAGSGPALGSGWLLSAGASLGMASVITVSSGGPSTAKPENGRALRQSIRAKSRASILFQVFCIHSSFLFQSG